MQISAESIQQQIPYYLTQEAKSNLIKALSSFPDNINYFINRYPDEVLQGDGWNSLDIINFNTGKRKEIQGLVLTNSCDVSSDNERALPTSLSFSPLMNLDTYIDLLKQSGIKNEAIDGKVTAIKEQRVTNIFFLPKSKTLTTDSIALLDQVHTIPFTHFFNKTKKIKLFTLSDVGFYLFLFKLSVHFCRFHENLDRFEEA